MTKARENVFQVSIAPPDPMLEQAYAHFINDYLPEPQTYYTVLRETFGIAGENTRHLIELQTSWALGKSLPAGWVPCSTVWAINGNQIVGEANVRHGLTPNLEEYGGQIGYYVLPTFRGRGVATQLLNGAIETVRQLNLERVLICCDELNAPSRRIIENAGGELLERRDNRSKWGQITCRYEIQVAAASST